MALLLQRLQAPSAGAAHASIHDDPVPVMLYVTMQPKDNLAAEEFHDWYNNEHGPLRLRLPFVLNGFRYRASDNGKPEWLAVYDITDMKTLTQELYLSLRGPPIKTEREKDVMSRIAVGRKVYDLLGVSKGPDFDLDTAWKAGSDKEKNVLVSASFTLKEWTMENLKEFDKWYSEEHVPLLRKVPGWRRSRRYVTSHIDGPDVEKEYVALHEYAPENGLGGPEYQAATNTKWRTEVFEKVVADKKRRTYNLYYTFGPAPRELHTITKWNSSNQKTFTKPDEGAVESFVTTKDGVELRYRLEGNQDYNAPLIILSNSILVDWGIWDAFISAFLADSANKKFRVLRYATRGRYTYASDTPVTVDLLASDIIALLDALRVPKAACVIGVSLGGATALNMALTYPDRVQSFIACDTNAKAPPSNPKAWGERIEMAEKEGSKANSESIVGDQLAKVTVERWFADHSHKEMSRVKEMVKTNSLEGFKKSVKALYEYEFTEEMKLCKVHGSFLVGDSDGVLPKTMKTMEEIYGGPKDFKVIEGAGHLPMVEKPMLVAEYVTGFLEK